MPLKFICPQCGQEIITQYLKTGEPCLCDSCKKYTAVPETATQVDNIPATPSPNPAPPGGQQQRISAAVGSDEPADRGTRLGAALIDGLIFMPLYIFFIFGAIITGDNEAVSGLFFIFAILVGLGVAGVQIYLLTTTGQTIGKKVLGIRIIKLDTGENGGFVTNVLLRSIVNGIICSVPFLGAFYSLTDILFIFAEDRRCIHDHLAGTTVIKVRKPGLIDPAEKTSLQHQI